MMMMLFLLNAEEMGRMTVDVFNNYLNTHEYREMNYVFVLLRLQPNTVHECKTNQRS